MTIAAALPASMAWMLRAMAAVTAPAFAGEGWPKRARGLVSGVEERGAEPRRVDPRHARRRAENVRIADQEQRTAAYGSVERRPRFDCDFGADPGGFAHADENRARIGVPLLRYL